MDTYIIPFRSKEAGLRGLETHEQNKTKTEEALSWAQTSTCIPTLKTQGSLPQVTASTLETPGFHLPDAYHSRGKHCPNILGLPLPGTNRDLGSLSLALLLPAPAVLAGVTGDSWARGLTWA